MAPDLTGRKVSTKSLLGGPPQNKFHMTPLLFWDEFASIDLQRWQFHPR